MHPRFTRHESWARPKADDAVERRGIASEPPVSLPVASGTIPVASATPEPPDEPAADFFGSNGFPVAP